MSLCICIRQLARDERGQDAVEYALLTAFFGLCALAAWNGIRSALGVTFSGTTSGVQGIWEPPPRPSGS